MKKLVALILCLALSVSLFACGKKADETPTIPEGAENQVYSEPSGEDTVASVYFLNHDAAMDAQWQSLAEAYEAEFSVEVKVLTAAEAYYAETLAEELEKDEYPTLFYAADAGALEGLEDTCLDLSTTELAKAAEEPLTAGGKVVGIPVPAGEAGSAGYWCVNAKASQLDVDATVAFLTWALNTQADVIFPQN